MAVSDNTRADCFAPGRRPFQPLPDRPGYSMRYYRAPVAALDDAELLLGLARKAVLVAAARKLRRR